MIIHSGPEFTLTIRFYTFMKNLLFLFASFSLFTTHFLLALTPENNGDDLAPSSLAGLEVEFHEIADLTGGGSHDYGLEIINFGEFEASAFDSDTQQIEREQYRYEKISSDSAVIIVGDSAGGYEGEFNITFTSKNYAEGRWYEVDEGESSTGTLTFRILDGSTQSGEVDSANHQTSEEYNSVIAPESLDGWVLRLEIDAADGEDVDIISFSAGQATESDEEGGAPEQLGSYSYEKISDSEVAVTISKSESDEAPTVLSLDFTSSTGQYDDFVNLDLSEVDSSFEPTSIAGQYRDLIGSGSVTFSVMSSPSIDEGTGGEDGMEYPATVEKA